MVKLTTWPRRVRLIHILLILLVPVLISCQQDRTGKIPPRAVKGLLDLTDWKMFFLPREGVERFLIEAHQHGLLEYYAAGSVTRLTFPASNLEEYADVLTQRTN